MAKAIKKKIKRRPWSKDDIREFKILARQKLPAPRIARKFRRSVPALRQKAMALGISLNSRVGAKRKR